MNDKSTEQEPENVAAKAMSGAKVLALRTAISQFIRIGSSVVVARSLSPEDFGVYAIVIYISGLGIYVQKLGLDAALTQSKANPSETTWRTAFVAQMLAATCYSLFICVFASTILRWFQTSADYVPLLAVATVQPLVAAMAFVSRSSLQRNLEFSTLAIVSFVTDMIGSGVACAMALSGYGVWTLVLAPLLGTIVGSVLLIWMEPWKPWGRIKLSSLRPLLRVGIPMQLIVVTPVLLNGWVPYFVSGLLGTGALGSVNLAQRLAGIPANYLQILNQVAFPAFSRIQTDPKQVVAHLASGIYRLSVLGCIGYVVLAPWLTDVVVFVYGEKWEIAGHLLQFLGMSTFVSGLVNMLGPALNALGHSWLRLATLIVTCGLPWIAVPILISKFGLEGVGVAIVWFAVAELLMLHSIVAWKIFDARELRQTVFVVVVLFVIGSIVLATTDQPTMILKITISLSGMMGLAALWWREERIGLEPTLLWFLRRLRIKKVAVV